MTRILASLTLVLALAACQTARNIDTPRERLAAAETAFSVATQSAVAAYRTGLIKPASDLDRAVDTAIKSAYSALVVWRTNPDSPDYMKAALAAMQPLLDMAAGLAAGKASAGFMTEHPSQASLHEAHSASVLCGAACSGLGSPTAADLRSMPA